MLSKTVLLVDPQPDASELADLGHALRNTAELLTVSDFHTARGFLRVAPPNLLVTNARLREYNGLHLALLAGRGPTRCIVYAWDADPVLIRRVREAGAFYEDPVRLPFAVASYVAADLPARDRRTRAATDRRQHFRGGRRSTDLPALHQSL